MLCLACTMPLMVSGESCLTTTQKASRLNKEAKNKQLKQKKKKKMKERKKRLTACVLRKLNGGFFTGQ